MKIVKDLILETAFKNRILISKLKSNLNLKNFIKRFNQNYINCDLVRIGGGSDGGYLLPNNLILYNAYIAHSPYDFYL